MIIVNTIGPNCGDTHEKIVRNTFKNIASESSSNGSTYLLDGVKDTQLPTCRRNGSNDIVLDAYRIRHQELPYNGHISRKDQTRRGEHNGIDVDAQPVIACFG